MLMLFWQSAVYLSAVRSSAWNYAETKPLRQPIWFGSFHNSGPRSGKFITEPRASILLAFLLLVGGALFYMGRKYAPLMERVQWADPLHRFLPVHSIMGSPDPSARAAAVLVREADAVERQDINGALALWAPDGVIVDFDFKPESNREDRTWTGMEQLRARYVREFEERHYESLRHLNLSVQMRGDEAIITDDLAAVFDTGSGVRRVYLRRSDRWVLRKDGNEWRIKRLETNRAAAPALSQSTSKEH